tara:strand:- start:1106 stop:1285 length:180 start_codon:yes stop_codon:yes gene_type:complete
MKTTSEQITTREHILLIKGLSALQNEFEQNENLTRYAKEVQLLKQRIGELKECDFITIK